MSSELSPTNNHELLTSTLSRQKEQFKQAPRSTAEQRIANLQRLDHALRHYQDDLASAVSDDFGHRSVDEFKLAELLYTLNGIEYCIKHVRKWMTPSSRHVPLMQQPGKAAVHYQPLGVVGIMVPWNYPIYLSIGPLMYALAAGNRAMIKMSSHTPKLNAVFKRMISEVFNDNEVATFDGSADLTEAFCNLPFDLLTFTGSTRVGKIVMAAASANLTPVILELGGKSPVIMHTSFPMAHFIPRLAFGKCWNAGQTCIAPDHLYLPRNRSEEFVEAFRAQIALMYPTLRDNPDYTSIINQRQRDRLNSYLDDARTKGATLIEINPANENFSTSPKLPITLVLGATNDMLVMQNEIFGPILPVIEYEALEQVIDQINERPRPLALYYLDYDAKRAQHIIDSTHAGGVTIADVMQHAGIDDMPFGGVGASGMGRYHGPEGFISMSNAKSVLVKGKLSGLKFILPPFNKSSHQLIKKYLLSKKN